MENKTQDELQKIKRNNKISVIVDAIGLVITLTGVVLSSTYIIKEKISRNDIEKILSSESNMHIDASDNDSLMLKNKTTTDGQYLLNFTYKITDNYEYEIVYSVDQTTYSKFTKNFNNSPYYKKEQMLQELAEKHDPIRSHNRKEENSNLNF